MTTAEKNQICQKPNGEWVNSGDILISSDFLHNLNIAKRVLKKFFISHTNETADMYPEHKEYTWMAPYFFELRGIVNIIENSFANKRIGLTKYCEYYMALNEKFSIVCSKIIMTDFTHEKKSK